MSGAVYHFLPWLREGLASRIRAPLPDEDPRRGNFSLGASLNSVALNLPPVATLGPGDVLGLDPAQVVRTDPVAGAAGFEPRYYPSVDLDSPTLPWLFTPLPATADRLTPWLCLVVVRAQNGVKVNVDPSRGVAELTIDSPADAAMELPDLTEAWAWAHVQVAGALEQNQTLSQVIATYPERVVSRLVCPTPLLPDAHYHACVVPTFAVGRDAALGLPLSTGLDLAWTAADHTVRLPVYHHWEFRTGAGADFASLVGALRFQADTTGLGERPIDVAGSGLSAPAEAAAMPPFVGALCPRDTVVEPAPAWVRQALAPLVSAAGTDSGALPLYGGDQAGVRAVAANDAGWLGELNLDPRARAIAALGAVVVRERQEQLAAAAWAQVGSVRQANELVDSARLAGEVGALVHTRHLAAVAAGGTLAQLAAPLQRTEAADVSTTTTYRRLTRPRGPFARRTLAAPPPPVPAGEREALLRMTNPANAVAQRLAQRVEFFAASNAAPEDQAHPPAPSALRVAPSYPTPMAGELARLAPQFLLPGAGAIPANSVVALRTNPTFVAAFLAGMNTEIASELRWREFPLDATATFVRQFWDRRGQGGGAGTSDIEPIAVWNRAQPLARMVTGATGDTEVVLVVRGELLRRFPRTAVYAIRAVSPTVTAPETEANISYPIFAGSIEPDIRFFGFGLTTSAATGADSSPGWFFAFAEQPTETRFGPPPQGSPLAGGAASSAVVAQRTLRLPVRVVVHAATLLNPTPPAGTAGGAQV